MADVPFGKKANGDIVRQHPRFRTKPLHRLSLTIGATTNDVKVSNISLGGVGLLSSKSLDEVGDTFHGILAIGNETFEVDLLKVFKGGETVGCRFENPRLELQHCIDRYFQTEILALKLSRVETFPNKNNKQDKVIFFHGQNNCELLINERNSQVCYFSIVILGNSLEVDPKKSVQSGVQIEDSKLPKVKGVVFFKPLETSAHLIENATRFIDGISDLTAEYKLNLIRLLTDTSLRSNSAKEKGNAG